METNYYKKVESYYDEDATDFEFRYWQNAVLQRIRQSFRETVKRIPAKKMLEIGFGPGFDLMNFARILPETEVYGVDISGEMVRLAQDKIADAGLRNAKVAQGSVEDVSRIFPNQKFDLIYVFFGALNTVADLNIVADCLKRLLLPQGKMVLTFVNKWYLAGMGIELLKLKPKSAFARLKPVWGGYSPTKHLASTCYSTKEIVKIFSDFRCETIRGYSIFYPAWYYHRLHQKMPKRLLNLLWKIDDRIGSGFMRGFGEYALYVFSHRDAESPLQS
ncbi:MAG: class I SAM-dependent methyltransferase [Cryomorphaceae bacterium]|nr:class I SAM-dependent methyltransferase [Cryomorphaceae bacterium]